ncbi:MAG: replication-relaxation family protein [Chloroflexota bacterium]|nr:replication-relaxation family protein [Chloroflexota bacterium]
MALSDRQLLGALSGLPFVESTELALIVGEPHATVHRALSALLAGGIVGKATHGTVLLPSSGRYFITTTGIREAAEFLDFAAPWEFVRAYPMSREWLTLLLRRMDAVASVYRLAATMSPGYGGLQSRVEFHRKGRFDAVITLHDGRDFGVVRQGLALRRRSLHERLRALAGYDSGRRPDVVLILVPSVWERRLTGRFCERVYLRDFFIAVESRAALERRNRRVWQETTGLFGHTYHTLEQVIARGTPGRRRWPLTAPPERKRASLPHPERMAQAAPAFGLSPSEKRTLDLITDHPMIPHEHLALWLGVSEGRVSQMMNSLVKRWGLIERHGKRGAMRYTLSGEGIRYATHRDRGELPTARGAWSTEVTTAKDGHLRYAGHRIETWVRQTKHTDGITWFLSQLVAETRADPGSEVVWLVPTAKSDRAYNWGRSAIAPDAVGEMSAGGHPVPFYLEHELRARHPRGVIARLRPYERYYWSPEHEQDQPPYPVTLFVVDGEEVEETYVSTAAEMHRMSLPILVSSLPVLSRRGILGESWRPLWAPSSPRLRLSGLRPYVYDALYHRMRQSPVGAPARGRR